MAAEAEAGTLQPTDFTDINHSFAFAAGAVISTAADLATWMEALAGGKVLDAEYQRLWQDSAKIIDPDNSYNWYGYGIDQLRWGPNTIDLHGGQTPGFNSEAAHDPANDMTFVIWANLTMSVEGKFTAADMMLKLLDQIYDPVTAGERADDHHHDDRRLLRSAAPRRSRRSSHHVLTRTVPRTGLRLSSAAAPRRRRMAAAPPPAARRACARRRASRSAGCSPRRRTAGRGR